MNWQEILTILIPMFAFLGWIYSRIDKKFEKIEHTINDLRKDVQAIESRVARIEGQLVPHRWDWEPKIVEKD